MVLSPAAEALRARLGHRPAPELLLVLGSGLSPLADAVENALTLPFASLPGFPAAGVEGHRGAFVAGRLEGREVLVQAGRLHRYEGHDASVVALPLRVAAELGVSIAIVTNVTGGIGRDAEPGTVVVLEDQIAAPRPGPLLGPVRPGEERFTDLSAPFDPALRQLALRAAAGLGLAAYEGIYGGTLGPAFETRAEIEMLRRLGADVVGMSTVDEVVQARARGLRVLGLSLVTNRAAGLRPEPLHHLEVLDGAARWSEGLASLIREVLRSIPRAPDGG